MTENTQIIYKITIPNILSLVNFNFIEKYVSKFTAKVEPEFYGT